MIEHAMTTIQNMGGELLIIQSDPNAEAFYHKAGGEIIGQRESGSTPGRYLPLFSVHLVGRDEV